MINEISKFRWMALGVGGAGQNSVSSMTALADRVTLAACDTDSDALAKVPLPNKMLFGTRVVAGHGCGGDSDLGMEAAKSDSEALTALIRPFDGLVLVVGVGGGAGTGGGEVIAQLAHQHGLKVFGLFFGPFHWEGKKRPPKPRLGWTEYRNSWTVAFVSPWKAFCDLLQIPSRSGSSMNLWTGS